MALCIMSKCGGWGEELAEVDFKVGYDIPKNVGMTMIMAKGEAWCFQFLKLRGDLSGLGVRKGLGLSTLIGAGGAPRIDT